VSLRRLLRRPARPGESVATAYYACWLDAVEALVGEKLA
jgi:hypothetical protein